MTEAAFCDAVQAYQQLLYHIAYLLLGGGADCEDEVQEAICHAWRRRDTLKNPASVKAWLCAIATNECRALLRKRRRRRETQDETHVRYIFPYQERYSEALYLAPLS